MTHDQTKALSDALFWIRIADICWRLDRLLLVWGLGWACLSCTLVARARRATR